jgi:hypothetical protein
MLYDGAALLLPTLRYGYSAAQGEMKLRSWLQPALVHDLMV